MIAESIIEQGIIDLLKADDVLKDMTIRASVLANNPVEYDVNNDIGAILVSCNGSENSEELFGRARLGRIIKVVVSLGARNIMSNEKLWEFKKLVSEALDYKKPFEGMGKLIPLNDMPKYPSPINGIFWIEFNYKIVNYIS